MSFKTAFRSFVFILLSSQLIYITIHLQFLFGMPHATLAVVDSLFVFFSGLGLYIALKGNKKDYFIGMYVVLLPTFIFQYFFIKLFNAPFLLSELKKFPDLIIVSTIPLKIGYISLFISWTIMGVYVIYKSIRNWIRLPILGKIVPLCILIFYAHFLSQKKVIEFTFDTFPVDRFYYKGILNVIRVVSFPKYVPISHEEVQESLELLKKVEQERKEYPISASPKTVPQKKRPIFLFIFESFYDFKDFIPYFSKDPFPKEYRDLMSKGAHTGPNATRGSFEARFTSLTGAVAMSSSPVLVNNYPHTLGLILQEYGYTTKALESVDPTYKLKVFYPNWGIDDFTFYLYGSDWSGKKIHRDTYLKNVKNIIEETPDNVTPFYFGFTYLGHSGSLEFTTAMDDPEENISQYLELFHDKHKAKQLLKSGIFNAQRIVDLKNLILKKYPDALIVFKADHLTPEFATLVNNAKNTLPQEFVHKINTTPFIVPLIMIDGNKGSIKLKDGISPGNVPLMVLAESGLPYKNTLPSLFYRELPKDTLLIHSTFYQKNEFNEYVISQPTNTNTLQWFNALNNISQNIYQSKYESHAIQILRSNINSK